MKKLLTLLPALLTLLGLIALLLVIWYVTPLIAFAGREPFAPVWVRLSLIAALLAFIIGRLLWQRWQARRNNARLIDGLARNAEAASPQASEAAILRERFEAAMKVLRESQAAAAARQGGLARLLSFGSSRHLYQLPWYVFIGAPGSGKTTALINSGLRFPLAEKLGIQQLKGVGGTRNCDWWFSDDAVLIDTAGRYTTQDSDAVTDKEAWKSFVGLLRRHRPRQPLNGVLLTVSMGDLLGASEAEMVRHAGILRTRVQELYDDLNVRLPVYVLVTKSDLIAGFNEFFADCSKEAREQVWGHTFPLAQDAAQAVASLPAQLLALRQRIQDQLIPRLQREADTARRAPIAAFDQQLATASRLLAGFLERVFAPTEYDHGLMLRGVYLTSGTQEGTPIDRVMAALGGAFGLQARVQPPRPGTGKSFFLTRLLREVVFAEQRVGGTNLKWERRRSLARLVGIAGLALLGCGLLLAWGVSYSRNKAYVAEVEAQLEKTRQLVENARISGSDDLPGLLPIIDAVRHVPRTATRADGVPLSLRFGLYQGRKLDAAAQQAYQTMLREVFFPRVAHRIESQLRNAPANNQEYLYEALKAYLMLFDAAHFEADALKAWITLDWERSLPGEVSAAQRDALTAHLDALFARGPVLAPIVQDQALVSSARNQLLRYSLPERIFSRIKRQGTGAGIPAFTLESALGPTALTVYARKSGAPLSQGIPGLFTYDGYHQAFAKALDQASQQLIAEEPWVLGSNEGRRRPDDADRISQEVRRLYLNEYVRLWDAFIDDIGIARAANLQQSIQIARVLSASDSPLVRLARALARETTLGSNNSPAAVSRAQGALRDARSDLGRMIFGAESAPRDAAPGKQLESIVDDHFAQLRAQIAGDEKTAPITGTVQLLNDVYVFLSAVETAQRDKIALPQSDVPARAKAESARLPEPVRGLLQDLAAAGTGQALSTLRQNLSSEVSSQIGQFCRQAIEGRYPFVRNSSRDVTRDDFAAIFGPGGRMDDFFNRQLAQYVDTSTRPWSFKRIQDQSLGGAGNLLQFQRAATIRDVFFRSGGTLRVDFKPLEMDPSITSFTLDVDGQLVRYAHGPQQLQSVQWPGPRGGLNTRIQITPPGPSGTSGMAIDGPWALFRMLDRANIEPGSNPERFRVSFAIDGRSAVFEVTTSSVQNPFRLRELSEFRCPDGL
jgi:type VI secretion system protein ImpL